jgi:hypothetical protein
MEMSKREKRGVDEEDEGREEREEPEEEEEEELNVGSGSKTGSMMDFASSSETTKK